MENQLSRDNYLNNVYNEYIVSASEVDEQNPDKYAWMCGWLDRNNQHKRFEMLLSKVKKNDTILDIGCGGGEMVKYLQEHTLKNRYTGIDINPNYITIAKAKYPHKKFKVSNGFNVGGGSYDWAVASGIFTVDTSMTYLLWYVGFIMARVVNKGFAFNLLFETPYDGLIAYNPEEIRKVLEERFPEYKIEIVTGYLPDDFTVYVTK